MGTIIWLASYPKSGNTWLRAFLANYIKGDETPVSFDEYWRYATNEASGHWYSPRLGGEVQAGHVRQIAEMRTSVQAEIAKSRPDHVLVKTHSHFGEAFGFPQINAGVTAGAVYVVRNPLDVVVSFARHNGASIDATIDTMAQPGTRSTMRKDRVFEWTSDWSGHVSSWTEPENPDVHVVRYEDMLADPETTFGQIVAFLRMEYDPAKFTTALRNASFDTLRGMERKTGFPEKPDTAETFFHSGTRDQWREVLSPDQVKRIQVRHRIQMERFGYVPE